MSLCGLYNNNWEIKKWYYVMTEAVAWSCFVKKMLFEIAKNTFYYRTPLVAASVMIFINPWRNGILVAASRCGSFGQSVKALRIKVEGLNPVAILGRCNWLQWARVWVHWSIFRSIWTYDRNSVSVSQSHEFGFASFIYLRTVYKEYINTAF